MNALDIGSIAGVNSSFWITDTEKWTGWVKTDDVVDSESLDVLSNMTSDVGTKGESNDRCTCCLNQAIGMQHIQKSCNELTNCRNAIGSTDVVDGSRAFGPIDENDVEIVVVKKFSRCQGADVTGVVFEPSVDQHAGRASSVEVAVQNRVHVSESQLLWAVAVLSG